MDVKARSRRKEEAASLQLDNPEGLVHGSQEAQ